MERRLSAIFAADMAGYARLIEADEVGTIERQKAHRRELIDPAFEQHHGRIVKEMGDGLLVEFPSVVEAIKCAVQIQRAMPDRETGVADHQRIRYRIGINSGDIVVDGDDIHGDGVNVAARLEQLAEPGGICISGTAYDHVSSQVDVNYESLGEVSVKNIGRPIRAYKVLTDPALAKTAINKGHSALSGKRRQRTAIAAVIILILMAAVGAWWLQRTDLQPVDPSEMAQPLPAKPSIAVLPFANLSDDPEQEYFSDGITNDIITGLSKFSTLFVIASNSTFRYKNKPTKVQDVARDLGIRYVLEGSVQRAGETLRINAQLIDATTGRHVWAENYEREAKDLFAVQREVMQKIVGVISAVGRTGGSLFQAEIERLARTPTENLDAYDFFLRGIMHMNRETKEDGVVARQLFEKAIQLDPAFSRAYAENSRSYLEAIWGDWAESREENLQKAETMALRAIELDNSEPHGYLQLGYVYQFRGRIEEAISMWEKAYALNKNDYGILFGLGYGLSYTGKPEEGVPILEAARRINPYHSEEFLRSLAQAYFFAGRYQDAIESLTKITRRHRTSYWLYLAASQAELGQIEEARASIGEALKLNPDLHLAHEIQRRKDNGLARTGAERFEVALRKAGLPE